MFRLVCLLLPLLFACFTQLSYATSQQPTQPQVHAVVFDIDGTLTPNVVSIFEKRKDAETVVHAYAQKGYKIIYLSARVSWASSGITAWLAKRGFPEGSVHVPAKSKQRESPNVYKTRVLNEYQAAGWKIHYAFGDSSTDFMAYAAAGIPKAHVFALQRRGRSSCKEGVAAVCLADWSQHLPFVASAVPAVNAGAGVQPTDLPK